MAFVFYLLRHVIIVGLMIIYQYVYFSCSEHYNMIKREGGRDIDKKHEANFERWFHKRLYNSGRTAANDSKHLYDLACGPDRHVRSYRGCIVNGVRYHTKECAETRTTQNSGVSVSGEDETSITEYYGELKNILELRYPGQNLVYLFECDWWDTGSATGVRMDQGFTIVNTSRKWCESDPFILACQASQVFYLDDPKLGGNWKVVQKWINRDIYDIPTVQKGDNTEDDQRLSDDVYQEGECVGGNMVFVDEANVEASTQLRRDDATIAIDELYIQLDASMFANDNLPDEDHDTNFDEEEELCSDNDIDSEHEEDSEHEQSSSSNSDTDSEYESDDEMC